MEKTRPCVSRLRGERGKGGGWGCQRGSLRAGRGQNSRICWVGGPEFLCLAFASLVWLCGWTMMFFSHWTRADLNSGSLSPGAGKLETRSPRLCRRKLFHASRWLYFSPAPTTYLQRGAVYFRKILLLLELWPDSVSIFWSRKGSSGMKLATHSASVLIVWEFLAGENLWAPRGIYFLFKFGRDFTLCLKRGTMV